MRRKPRREPDSGFTLVELLVSVSITGVIALVIAACIIVGLKTTNATATRLAESHDAQILSTYLVADVQSVSETGYSTVSSTPTGCGPAGDESQFGSSKNVLTMSWIQSQPGPATSYVAAYRSAKNLATAEWQLLRYACTNGGAATDIVVARQLRDPAVTPPSVDVSHQPSMSMTLTEPSGYVYTVAAVRRTPPSSPLPVVPWACTTQSALATPDPSLRTSALPGPLTADISIDVQSGGDCPSLTLLVDPGGSPVFSRSLTEFPAGSGHWTTTLSRTTGIWTDGDKSFPIEQGSEVIGSLKMTVKQQCLVSTFSVDPAPARRAPGAGPGGLSVNEVLSVTSSGPCLSMVVDVPYDPSVATAVVPLTETSAGMWSATVPAAGYAWTDGSHVLAVHESAGGPLSSRTLIVTPNCVVTASTVTPSPVDRDNGIRNTMLLFDVNVGITTTGSCTALRIEFKPDGTSTAVVSMSGGPSSWAAVLAKAGYTWTRGTKNLLVKNSDNDLIATLSLTVN